jgi:hypothetical protein
LISESFVKVLAELGVISGIIPFEPARRITYVEFITASIVISLE